MKKKILIVDDEKSMLEWMKIALEDKYDVITIDDPVKFEEIFEKINPDLVITDIKMPKLSGFDILEILKNKNSDVPCLLMTAYASLDSAIEALRKGAKDYLVKPFSEEELVFRIKKIIPKEEEKEEFVAVDKKTLNIKKLALKAAQTDVPVFIYGESGTGKEVIAKFIHNNSKRKEKKFVAINCAAFPSELLESELFGYKKGAFTGAYRDKKGLFEIADKGTILLDEICEMPLNLQAKLLRVIETGEITPLGSINSKKIDVRIISATNIEPKEAIKKGKLRQDLYFRISTFPIYIPPLRERKKDIEGLIEYFLAKISKKLNKELTMDEEVKNTLIEYEWPGNVRELENVIERACILCEDNIIRKEHLPPEIFEEAHTRHRLRELEEKYIMEVLEEVGGNVRKAAKLLGVHPSTIYRKLKKIKNGQ